MLRIIITLEYDGANYYGWQFQKGQITIQEAIEKALFTIFKKKIRVTGAGRTDAGVHARNQIAHFDIPTYDVNKLKNSLNGLLERDIRVKNIQIGKADFHSRFDARSRRYCYYISQFPTALYRNYSWQVSSPLNLTLMQEAALFIGLTQNFKSFCKVKSEVKNYQCTIYQSRWFFSEALLVYEIEANRFLHGMIRAMVGSMVEVGNGKINLSEFKAIIGAGDRTLVKTSAPAQGLFLEWISY